MVRPLKFWKLFLDIEYGNILICDIESGFLGWGAVPNHWSNLLASMVDLYNNKLLDPWFVRKRTH